MKSTLLVLFSVLLLPLLLRAQTTPSGELEIHDLHITIEDTAHRPFDAAIVEVSLMSAQGYQNGQTVSRDTVEYVLGDENGTRNSVNDGEANARVLVPSSGEPFHYRFRVRGPEGKVYVTRDDLAIDMNTRSLRLVAIVRAPVNNQERWGSLLFFGVAVVLVILTFGYLAFRRMLFNRRMNVHNAILWSNILTVFYILLAISTVLLAYCFPSLFTAAAWTTYLGLVVIFLGIYLFGFTVMLLMTRPVGVRS